MVHDDCVGASFAAAAAPLATSDSAPVSTSTGSVVSKVLTVSLTPGALPPDVARATHLPPEAPLPHSTLQAPRGAAGELSGRGARSGVLGDEHSDAGVLVPVVQAGALPSNGQSVGRVDSAPAGAPRGGGAAAVTLPPSAHWPPQPTGGAVNDSGGGTGSHARGGGHGQRPGRHDTALSRRLSRLLRHDLLAAGLVPAPDGYVPLAAVLRCRGFRDLTVGEVCACVANSEKKRFSVVRRVPRAADGRPVRDGSDADWGTLHIRANQGFSSVVAASLSADAVYTRLVPPAAASPPLLGVHATTPVAFARIAGDEGLRAMRRDAIHFAPLPLPPTSSPAPTAESPSEPRIELDVLRRVVAGVRSGRRRDGQLVDSIALVVDVGASAAAGVVWHVSSNGVLLTQGGEGGVLAKRWVVRVTDVVSGADRTADLWVSSCREASGKA